MSKILINSNVKSKGNNEKLKKLPAIKNKDEISYFNRGISVCVYVNNNSVKLVRESDEFKIELLFENNKEIESKYYIKKLGLSLSVKTITKKLVINSNDFMIEYDLYMNGEFSDSFEYILSWEDM